MRGRGGRGFVVLSQPESPNLLASCSWLRNSGSQLRLRQRIVGAPCLGDARLLHVSTISQREAIHLVNANTRATSTFATLHFDRLPTWRRANLDRLSGSDWNCGTTGGGGRVKTGGSDCGERRSEPKSGANGEVAFDLRTVRGPIKRYAAAGSRASADSLTGETDGEAASSVGRVDTEKLELAGCVCPGCVGVRHGPWPGTGRTLQAPRPRPRGL